jgi:DNA-binding HxlR family transcriptional regulator/putative sterol carrier protein
MRSYQQFCPAARALDVIGERWTLLVIRELLAGPKRYTDLQDGLPGIGPNVLAARLRSLEEAGVVEKKRLPPPAASTVYVLTERGAALRKVLAELFEWGLGLTDKPGKGETVRASYWLPAIEAAVREGRRPEEDVNDVYEFRIGEESIAVRVAGGEVRVSADRPDKPDVVLTTDARTFAELGRGATTSAAAIESGRLSVEGDPEAAARCAALFGMVAEAETARA